MSKLRHLIPILFITIFSIVLYANTLRNGFVYDDWYFIVNNTEVQDFRNLSKLFGKEYFAFSGELSYRPVVTFTNFLDYALYDLSPWGYHLTNTIFHAINGILLYMFLTLITKLSEINNQRQSSLSLIANKPLIVTLLFVTHPALTEAVNAISFREDLLFFFFYMTSFSLYLALRSTSIHGSKHLMIYLISCLTYFLALLSKEMAATLPLVIYCYEWIYSNKRDSMRGILLNPYNWGYLSVTLVYISLRFYFLYNPVEDDITVWPLIERVLTLPSLLLSYLKLAAFPLSLSADYIISPVKSFFSPIFFFPFIAIIFLITVAFRLLKKEPDISFGILFFLITLMPVYNIIPISYPFAERYFYLPTVGFVIMAGSIIHRITQTRPFYVATCLLLIISINSINIALRNNVWRDSSTLWSDTAKKMPNSWRAHYNLGLAYRREGDIITAIQEFKAAVRLKPDYVQAHNNLGASYYLLGQLEAAIQEFMTVIRLNPDYSKAHYNLGKAYEKMGLKDAARTEFERDLKLRSDYMIKKKR